MKRKRILSGILSFVMAFMLVAYMPDPSYAGTSRFQELGNIREASGKTSLSEEENLPQEGLEAKEPQDLAHTEKEETTTPKEGLEAEENQEITESGKKEDSDLQKDNLEENESAGAEESREESGKKEDSDPIKERPEGEGQETEGEAKPEETDSDKPDHSQVTDSADLPEETTEAETKAPRPEDPTEAGAESSRPEAPAETGTESSKPEAPAEAETKSPRPEETTEAETESPRPEAPTEAATKAPRPEETTEAETESPRPEETTAAEEGKPEEIVDPEETIGSETEGSGMPGHLASGSNASGSGSIGAGSGGSTEAGSGSSQKENRIPTAEELEAMPMEAILKLFWSLDEEERETLISLLPEEEQEEFFDYMLQQALGETIVVERDIQSYTEVAPFLTPIAKGKARKMSRSRASASMEEMEEGTNSWIQPDGVITKKTIEPKEGEHGKYELTLEAYVEGQVSIVTEMVPTDIVFVLDESGSMEYNMTSTSYTKVIRTITNGGLYQGISAGNELAYQLEDGSFATVRLDRSGSALLGRKYTYSYRDSNNRTVTIQSSGSGSEPFNDSNFIQANLYWGTGSIRRVDVLKSSLNQFMENIADSDGSDQHRIAIVGFSSGSNIKTGKKVAKEAFVPVAQQDGSVNDALITAINSLKTEGATRSDLGLANAKNIFGEDSKNEEKRNRVVIMFTDGVPTTNSSFSKVVANDAIGHAKSMKDNGVTIYTIGIFDGANPAQKPITNQTDQYMHYVSSNYPNARNLTIPGSIEKEGYYLAAKDAQDLNHIFEQISQEVGSADYALDETTVIRDIITPEFKLPEGADERDISVFTADYEGNETWGKLQQFDDAEIMIDGKTVDISNFDFHADGNFVTEGTEPKGKKLVIKIPIEPDYGQTFGGGTKNTNAEGSGLWKDGKGVTPFTSCEAYIPIRYETNVTDQAVYLTNQPDYEKLIQYTDGFVPDGINNRDVDITYTFQKGQQVVASYTIPNGKTSGELEVKEGTVWEKDDAEYTVICTVTPKDGSDPVEITPKKKTAMVYILKPTLTFKDSQIYLGEKPESYDPNKDETLTVWSNGSKPADLAVLEDGTTHKKPEIGYEFSPMPENGEWAKDTYVTAKIKIGEVDITQDTTFAHSACSCSLNRPCQFEAENGQDKGQFIIHVLPCTLTIQKDMGNREGDKLEAEDQVFLFQVTGQPGQANSGVDLLISITGTGSKTITGLPVGAYTVEEKENWSWRYQADGSVKTAELSSSTPKGQVTVVNHLSNRQWLSDETQETNRFQGKQGAAAVREVAYLREEKYEF